MVQLSERLQRFLDQQGVRYEAIGHTTDFTAQHTAADTHTPGREFAKTVVVRIDGEPAFAVLPAHHRVDLDRLRDSLGAVEVELCSEHDMEQICPDCDTGAVPPFGNLYDVPVFLSPAMADDDQITFNGGNHETAVRMALRDFERLVHPRMVDLSREAS